MSGSDRVRGRLIFAGKTIVSALALGFLLTRVDLGETFRSLSASDKLPWAAALCLMFLSQVMSTFRWRILLRPLGFHFPWGRVFKIYFVGMFFSLFLPSIVGGDAVKTYYVAGSWKRAPAALYTILADRTIGLAAQQVYAIIGLVTTWGIFSPVISSAFLALIGLLYLCLAFLPRLSGFAVALVGRFKELSRERVFVYWTNPGAAVKGWVISLFIHFCLVAAHMLMGGDHRVDLTVSTALAPRDIFSVPATGCNIAPAPGLALVRA